MKDWSPDALAALEANLRRTHWKQLVKDLKTAVKEHHQPVELPTMIRRWLEINRGIPRTEEEAKYIQREAHAIKGWVEAQSDAESARWFQGRTESLPISGWAIEATHVLRDGARWWIFSDRRHDDKAPLAGPIVPAPASDADLRKLRRLIDFAGGSSKRELFRTGAISQAEHDELLAAGKPDIAEYGRIFYWWKA